jgi:cell division transport system permease protein
MKSIKSHISLLLPLLTILFGLQFILSFERIVEHFEQRLTQQYTMIIAAKNAIDTETVAKNLQNVQSLEPIAKKSIIERFSQNMPKDLIQDIEKDLPFFYSVKLDKFLGSDELEAVTKEFLKNSDIVNAESFKANHNQTYELLKLVQFAFQLFVGVLTLVSFMLVYKQIVVWELEHSERMQIMALFGAPLMLRSGVLYKLGFINAIIAAIMIAAFFYYANSMQSVNSALMILDIDASLLFLASDFFILLGFALVTVFLAVSLVIFNSKE